MIGPEAAIPAGPASPPAAKVTVKLIAKLIG